MVKFIFLFYITFKFEFCFKGQVPNSGIVGEVEFRKQGSKRQISQTNGY